MNTRRVLAGYGLVALLYLAAIFWADSQNGIFADLPSLLSAFPVLLTASLLSYLIRYARWHWLLRRGGSRIMAFQGFLAYLTGFAFTATPGKVGELIRIRYFLTMGVPPWKVLAAFVYERSFDLLAVLVLASLFSGRRDVFIFVAGFVFLFLGGVALAAINPHLLSKTAARLKLAGALRLSNVVRTLRDGLYGCRLWLTPIDALVSFVLALAAWSVTALSFVYLLNHLSATQATLAAFAVYPLAMLAGAASMLPGGVGSTEATMIALLAVLDVPVGTATLAAIGIRLATLWFAVFCGFLAAAWLGLAASLPVNRD